VNTRLRRNALLFVALAASWSSVVAQDRAPTEPRRAAGRFEAVLSRAGGPYGGDAVDLAREILDLGNDAVDRSFDALAREIDRGAETSSDSPRLVVLWTVFDLAGRARWRPVIDRRLDASPGHGVLAASTTILRDGGTAQDLDLLLRAGQLDLAGECREEFQAAVTQILSRDANGFGVLEATIPLDQEHVWPAVVAGVEDTRRARAAEVLVHWIERHKVLRLACLQHLSRLALSLPKPFPEDWVTGLRSLLERGESDTLPDLLVCLGRLEDDASIPLYLRWLKEGEHAVRKNALWALQYTTRLTFDEDPKAWLVWWRDESTWWEKESVSAFASLRRGTKAEKVAALNAIDVRRTGRHRLAAEVAPALRDRDPDVACLAAFQLGNLGSPVVVDDLIDALGSTTASLERAAHEALERIARRKLPEDAEAIRSLVGHLP